METSAILRMRISLAMNVRAKTYRTITLFEALNAIRTEVYGAQIKKIRNYYCPLKIFSGQ